ncbi:hypothetical protein PG991_002869 [Apiospora marii]|uniref:Uncharacterized protein n=1 Tax=Apiospora marii TaxID=335849 RepID=A0ABR1SHW3_9PEZI
MEKDNTSDGSPAPQATKCQPEPNDPVPSNSTTRITQDVIVFMGFIACSLAICHHHLQYEPTASRIALLTVLRCLNWFMGLYVVRRHEPIHEHYNLPNQRYDCSVASLLAIGAFVLYHEGQVGWAFLVSQATLCYWIGYWLEWWTGIVALLFSVFDCPAGLGRRHVSRDDLLDDDDKRNIRHTVIGRFVKYLEEIFKK